MATAADVLKRAEALTAAGDFEKARTFYNAIIERMPDTDYAKQAQAGLKTLAEKEKIAGVDFSDLDALWQESVKNITPKDKLKIRQDKIMSENPAAFTEKPKPPAESVQPQTPKPDLSEKDYSFQTRLAFKNDGARTRSDRQLDWQNPAIYHRRYPHREERTPHFVIWKLVSGVLSIVFCLIILFQSCAAGVYNALSANGEVSGTAGGFVAVFMLAGGIVSIASRKSVKNGGNIALAVIFFLAAIMGFANAGSYSDLNIWSAWCLICGIIAVAAAILNKNS